MRVPLAAPGRFSADLRSKLDDAISAVLDSGIFLMGSQTEAFEREFAAYCGVAHCVSVANGTEALELSLRASGVGARDEVITVANAGGYSTTACLHIKAVPVYVDIDPRTLTMDLGAALTAVGPKTAAIIVTHLYGWPVDVLRLRSALRRADRSDIRLIEDCAQAHGATVAGQRVGSLGDLAAFSFYPTKNLGALGDAGAVVTSDEPTSQRLRMLRHYGWADKYHEAISGGRNSRMDEIQAAVLRVMLQYLDDRNRTRRAIIARYEHATAHSGALKMVHSAASEGFVAHLAIASAPNRDSVRRALRDAGIDTGVHYPVLDVDQPTVRNSLHRMTTLDGSRHLNPTILSLPCFPTMSPDELDHVSGALRQLASSQV
jgi:aminotransferase EvaB